MVCGVYPRLVGNPSSLDPACSVRTLQGGLDHSVWSPQVQSGLCLDRQLGAGSPDARHCGRGRCHEENVLFLLPGPACFQKPVGSNKLTVGAWSQIHRSVIPLPGPPASQLTGSSVSGVPGQVAMVTHPPMGSRTGLCPSPLIFCPLVQ